MNEVESHYGSENQKALGGSRSHERESGDRSSGIRNTAGDAYDRASEWGRDNYRGATSWASDQYGSATRGVDQVRRRSGDEFDRARREVTKFVDENPIMVGVVGVAAGLLLGALIPGTKRENQAFGRYADEVREQGYRYARDLADQGKSYVEEGLQNVAANREAGVRDDGGGDQQRAQAEPSVGRS